LEGCLAFLDCRIVASYPGGDHTIFLGQVEDLGILQGGDPLVFYRSQYRSLGP
jgi:flavin reductase (DIM6/NTAB) family NADH-FMN oxidoreductase RutF